LSPRSKINMSDNTEVPTTTTTTASEVPDRNEPLTDYSIIIPKLTGIVKWFNNKSGFGFITVCEEGDYKDKDIFVHYTSIRVSNQQYKYLVQGEYVDFTLVKANSDTHEFQAMNVSGVKGGPIMCEIRRTTQLSDPNHRPPRRDVGQRRPVGGDDDDRPRQSRRPAYSNAGGERPPPRRSAAPPAAAKQTMNGDELLGFTKVERKSTRKGKQATNA
jgi:cold shock CspA family protein